jgi:hypothetical protein
MTVFRHAVALSSLVLPLLFMTGPTAEAVPPVPAVCSLSVVVEFSPGMTMNPAVIRSSSGGETGRLDCSGEMRGASVSGSGTFGVEVVDRGLLGGATCGQESGSGTVSMTIPTAAGEVKLTEPASVERVGASGTIRTPSFLGTFQGVPLVGDCVTAPVTKVLILAAGVLVS